jgi:hypothetical protein
MKYNETTNCFIISSKGLTNIIIKSSLGAKSLYHLINNEGRSFKPTVLRNMLENKVDISPQTQQKLNIKTKEEQILYQTLHLYIPATDMKAIIDVKKRKGAVDAELLEARTNNDLKRIDDLIKEKEDLENYLIDTLDRNGAIRNLNHNNRNAKKSITRALEITMNEIAEKSHDIYQILKTGLILSTNQVKYFKSSKE